MNGNHNAGWNKTVVRTLLAGIVLGGAALVGCEKQQVSKALVSATADSGYSNADYDRSGYEAALGHENSMKMICCNHNETFLSEE